MDEEYIFRDAARFGDIINYILSARNRAVFKFGETLAKQPFVAYIISNDLFLLLGINFSLK
jgi:hypothetical protein